jgi:hypothetical protein
MAVYNIVYIVEHKGECWGFTKTAYLRIIRLRLMVGPAAMGEPKDHAGQLLITTCDCLSWSEFINSDESLIQHPQLFLTRKL